MAKGTVYFTMTPFSKELLGDGYNLPEFKVNILKNLASDEVSDDIFDNLNIVKVEDFEPDVDEEEEEAKKE